MLDKVWFSRREYIYNVKREDNKLILNWSNNVKIQDYDNCNVYVMSRRDKQVRVIIRRDKSVYSEYRKRYIKINYMLDFIISSIQEPRIEAYQSSHRDRLVFQLDNDYWIWQFVDDNSQREYSKVYEIYNTIKKKLDGVSEDIFPIEVNDDNIIPVVYQPAIDAYNNFLREMHCHKLNDKEIEVTLLFNNEELREHRLANRLYEWFRHWFYGRKIDVESFKILLEDKKARYFQFPGIYSGKNGIDQDDIHEDKPDHKGNVPKRKILYYFGSYKHPIVFINTSNHSMAEYDNNNRLWKWEYLGWEEDSPIIYGDRSRREIDISFKPFWSILIDLLRSYMYIINERLRVS